MGSQRVRHNWTTSLSLFTFMHWRRKWQPTPVFLPGESQGRQCLVDGVAWSQTQLKQLSPMKLSPLTHRNFSVPCFNWHVLGQLALLQGILKARSSRQMVPAAYSNFPWPSPSSHEQQASWLTCQICYWVQAHSAHQPRGQLIWEIRCWGKEYDFIQRAG